MHGDLLSFSQKRKKKKTTGELDVVFINLASGTARVRKDANVKDDVCETFNCCEKSEIGVKVRHVFLLCSGRSAREEEVYSLLILLYQSSITLPWQRTLRKKWGKIPMKSALLVLEKTTAEVDAAFQMPAPNTT
jgi:hypothetical protein